MDVNGPTYVGVARTITGQMREVFYAETSLSYASEKRK